ncbi:MAG: hypothetical protein V4757_02240 [Pseudomonadota bacterium]
MKSVMLIALVALTTAAGASIAKDASFEVPQPEADDLVAAGQAKPADAAGVGKTERKGKAATFRARVLTDCAHGKANDVVTVTAAELDAGESGGTLDGAKAAVAYAMSLEQNKASE